MSKIGIIGLGHVGRLLAHQLVLTAAADELALIDQDDQLALALQTDLQDAETALASHPKIVIQDYAALTDAQIIVVAVGKSSLIADQPMAELTFNHDAIKQVAAQ